MEYQENLRIKIDNDSFPRGNSYIEILCYIEFFHMMFLKPWKNIS